MSTCETSGIFRYGPCLLLYKLWHHGNHCCGWRALLLLPPPVGAIATACPAHCGAATTACLPHSDAANACPARVGATNTAWPPPVGATAPWPPPAGSTLWVGDSLGLWHSWPVLFGGSPHIQMNMKLKTNWKNKQHQSKLYQRQPNCIKNNPRKGKS